jgi:hypothetical protein
VIDFEITKTPILVVASPRTGSNAFTTHLGSKYPTLKCYSEPDHNIEHLSEFLNFAKNNNGYILKILASSMVRYPNWLKEDFFSEKFHTIIIKRRSLVEQLASHYIAMNRNIWYYNKENYENWQYKIKENIDIDEYNIKKTISMVKYDIDLVNRFKSDNIIFYEDMPKLITQHIKTPRPVNYFNLLNKIEEILNKYRIQ